MVTDFRTWNWESSYNDSLLGLTDARLEKHDWPRLRSLWEGVIVKRRKLFNEVQKIERQSPGTPPAATARLSQERLLESLERVRSFSAELGSPDDTRTYASMIDRVEAGKRA